MYLGVHVLGLEKVGSVRDNFNLETARPQHTIKVQPSSGYPRDGRVITKQVDQFFCLGFEERVSFPVLNASILHQREDMKGFQSANANLRCVPNWR